ncbi:FHA domain-containing protein [Aeromicrobium fastidiosum]|uniref:FHA domain-containing protein n=2 Tax=Aeromicrobium fastidiosum TaxID=52699 RepID=A0A641AIH5_9ACTN|nr:FHA domain-containing protein [Aeromicrobium fastidiosum]
MQPAATRDDDPGATIAEVGDSRFDAMFGVTVPGRRLEDAAVRESLPAGVEPQPASPASVLGDHDGRTTTAVERAALLAGRISPPRVSAAAVSAPTARATMTFSTGRSVELDRPVVVGRSPRAHGASSAEMPHLVVIDNPYVSGTHLSAAIEDGVVVVTDLSTNGTLLTAPGEASRRLDKGLGVVVPDASVLKLSDDISVTITITAGH